MKTVLLIGLGRFGYHIADQLHQLGHEVMAIDRNEERVNQVLDITTSALIGDSTNRSFLDSVGVRNFDLCIVAIGNDFQGSLETTALLKSLGAKNIVSLAERDTMANFLLNNGADSVVYPEKQFARWIAIRYTSDHILDYLPLNEELAIYEIPVPDHWIARSIAQLDVRRKYNITILAIKHNGRVSTVLSPDTVLRADMTLLVLGDIKGLQKRFR